MLKALYIDAFRSIKNLKLEGLEAVNLLLGDNDVGKTSILEAINLFERPDDLPSILRASRMRMINRPYIGSDFYSSFESFLHLFPLSEDSLKRISVKALFDSNWHHIEISGEIGWILGRKENKRISLERFDDREDHETDAFFGELSYDGHARQIVVAEDEKNGIFGRAKPYINIVYVAPGLHFGKIRKSSFGRRLWELETIKALRIIDPTIEGIKLVPSEYEHGYNLVIEHEGNREVPLYMCGDGLKKILSLASILPAAREGILMVDEIETSLQAKHLPKVFSWLLRACEDYKTQLFVTTHSIEAISALSRCAINDPQELACFRIEKYDGKMLARRYSERRLEALVNGSGLDVR